MTSGLMLILALVITILFIVIVTSKFKMHPFLALILASYLLAFMGGIPTAKVADAINSGFGGTLTSIGIVIIAGCIIGTILEKSGAAIKMADVVIKLVGKKRPALAMSIIGYIVSIPVFCDSGFVILSSLNKSLAKRTKTSMVTMTIALSTGLYATHTLVPPTPGPIAAAANLKVENLLLVILVGMVVAIPAALVGYLFAIKQGPKYTSKFDAEDNLDTYEAELEKKGKLPSAWKSFAPIIIPILLMAIGSIAGFPSNPFGKGVFKTICVFFGTPVNALLIGMFFSFTLLPKFNMETLNEWVGASIKDAAIILVVTAAGGSLGNVIKQTNVGTYIGQSLSGLNLGIFLPFIIAAALKTAQGSSTVAIVTTSALMYPLLPSLGLNSVMGAVLVVAAVGAGAMTVSHANDSYFWVVSQFGGLDVKTAYKTQTVGTLLEGIAAILMVYILSLILL
jgi:GntP family gluconate:H+ symporter